MKQLYEKIYPQHNLRIINFTLLFNDYISVNLVNDFHLYKLLTYSKVTSDIKKLLYHHIILGLCNQIVNSESFEKCVVIFNPEKINSSELFKYYKWSIMSNTVMKIVKDVNKTLPVKFFITDQNFSTICRHIEEKTGEGKELLNKLIYLSISRNDSYTFSKALKDSIELQLTKLHCFLNVENTQMKLLT